MLRRMPIFTIRRIAVKNKEGEWVVMNRNAKIAIYDENGREREKYPVVYGAKIKVKDGGRVEIGQKLVEWDPYSLSILTDVGGKVAYGDITEGVTMKEEFDEVTGLSRKVVIEHSGATMRPRISIKDDSGKTAKVSTRRPWRDICFRSGAHILVEKGSSVHPGDVLGENSSRDDQDQRHHRRSSARGRTVRGEKAEGAGRHQRN